MKKWITALFLSLLFCALLSLGATGASKGKMTLSGDLTDLKRGETVELSVQLGINPGVKTLRCTVGYDPMILEFVSAEGTKTLPDFSYENEEGELLLRWQSEVDTIASGEVAKLVLRVKNDALYGDSAVTLNISEILYDAQNSLGEAIPFDTAGVKFTLQCTHENPEILVEKEATFVEEGILTETCPTCGNVNTRAILPTVESHDGRVKITFPTDEFLLEDQVEVSLKFLLATKEGKDARELLSGDVKQVFRIHIYKNGELYIPAKDCTVTFRYDADLPEGAILYGLMDGGAFQPEIRREGNLLEFSYTESVLAVVVRHAPPEPEVPVTTTAKKTVTTIATTAVDPEEAARQKELSLIVAGGVVLVLCGTGIILLLGKRKRF